MNPHDPNPIGWENLRYQVAQVAKVGFTVKLGWIDNDPHGRLNGIRFMSAQALFDKALSIQVFDRSTVTLGWGFSNDDHATLTKEDGRLFLEWLKDLPNTPLVSALWDLLPEGEQEPAPTAAATTNMAKARLVDYLVHMHAVIFGRYGTMTANGEDFYDAVLNLIRNPERDGQNLARTIHALESIAHSEYQRAVFLARDLPRSRWEALGAVLCAEALRQRADDLRQLLATSADRADAFHPAPAEFPEAITAEVILGKLHALVSDPRPSPPATDTTPEKHLKPGDLVVIKPGQHNPGQIGEVFAASNDKYVTVKFKDGAKVTYILDEVEPMATSQGDH